MAREEERRRGAPRRTLIGPLVMLATGALTGVVAWRLLMYEDGIRSAAEHLSVGDRRALDGLLHKPDVRP